MTCINTGNFPLEWKKVNALPVHKKIASEMLKTTVLYDSLNP